MAEARGLIESRGERERSDLPSLSPSGDTQLETREDCYYCQILRGK